MMLSPVQERIRSFAVGSVLVAGAMAGAVIPWHALIDGSESTARMTAWWVFLALCTAFIAGTANGLWRLQSWARTSATLLCAIGVVAFAATFAWTMHGADAITHAQAVFSLIGIGASLFGAWYFTRARGVAEAFADRVLIAPPKPQSMRAQVSDTKTKTSRRKSSQ